VKLLLPYVSHLHHDAVGVSQAGQGRREVELLHFKTNTSTISVIDTKLLNLTPASATEDSHIPDSIEDGKHRPAEQGARGASIHPDHSPPYMSISSSASHERSSKHSIEPRPSAHWFALLVRSVASARQTKTPDHIKPNQPTVAGHAGPVREVST
jgi:hypothetical protein